MTKTKHTPGPWNLSSIGDGRTYVEASNETADDIACLLMDHDQRQNAANARLIVAAPDLLDFTRRFESSAGFFIAALPTNHGVAKDLIALRELARAAIAKAKGHE